MINIGNFTFDLDKFILLVHKGASYKTDFFTSKVVNKKGYLTISREEDYRLEENFIIDNLDVLIQQKVVFPRGRKK